jgi:protein TonB
MSDKKTDQPGKQEIDKEEIGLVPVLTLVLWVGCVVVAVLGKVLHTPPPPPTTQPGPIDAQLVNIALEQPLEQVMPDAQPSPAPPDAPQAPPLPAVALPSPAIAMELPVEGPSRLIAPQQAAPQRTVANPEARAAPASHVQRLTFGQGEGRQPAPEYPTEAIYRRQEGVVVILMTVGEDGHVIAARVEVPCPYAILNQAALRAVRQTWHFPAGPMRNYEIAIQFELTQ